MNRAATVVLLMAILGAVTVSLRYVARSLRSQIQIQPATRIVANRPEIATGSGMRTFTGRAMGAGWKVILGDGVPIDSDQHESLVDEFERAFDQIDREMSHWRTDSTVAKFNRLPASDPMPISADLAVVLRESLKWHQASAGAFEITVGPLVNLWGFGPSGPRTTAPSADEIRQAVSHIGSQLLKLDRAEDRTWQLAKQRDGVELDLSAIAPGFAADRLGEILIRNGVREFLVDVGGEMLARGESRPGQPWRVGLELPDERQVGIVRRELPLKNRALATSGSYRRYRKDETTGQRVSHILDPRTGRPIAHSLISVTVIADSAMTADAVATLLMVLGPDEGFEFARQHQLSATFVFESHQRLIEKWTPEFAALR